MPGLIAVAPTPAGSVTLLGCTNSVAPVFVASSSHRPRANCHAMNHPLGVGLIRCLHHPPFNRLSVWSRRVGECSGMTPERLASKQPPYHGNVP